MYLAFQQSRLVLAFISFIAGILCSFLVEPSYKYFVMKYWQGEFSKRTFQCDQSMRLHYVAKRKVGQNPSEETATALQVAEIGLLDCQTYDLLQKKLVRLGLTENEIGEMVLIAAESNEDSMRKIVGIHEIEY